MATDLSKRTRQLRLNDLKALARSKGGLCLSKTFVNMKTPLKWRCKLGHEWEATPQGLVYRDSWCEVCSRKTRGNRKHDIGHFKWIAKEKGGRCLSNDYDSPKTKLSFRCQVGHEWQTRASNILGGSWCWDCYRERAGINQRKGIKRYQQIAKKRGGDCPDQNYRNNRTKLSFVCKVGHLFEARPYDIDRGNWCPKCAGRGKTIDDMRELAEEKGGKCLSSKLNTLKDRLRWKCSAGHIWITPASAIVHGRWCPICASKSNIQAAQKESSLKNKKNKKPLSLIKSFARSRGGRCISKEYVNAHRRLDWQCRQGHSFSLSWNKVQQGGWCPSCNRGIGERITRAYFEQIFGQRFDPAWPIWLRNKEGNRLELDGYSERLQLAFEHQGVQHYKKDTFYSGDFKKRQRDDQRKVNLCRRHGVKLIRVPELNNLLKLDRFLDFLIKEFDKRNIAYPKQIHKIDFNLSDAYSYSYLEEMKRFAASNGGRLVSQRFLGRDKTYLWECMNGHRFKIKYSSLRYNPTRGSWCPVCRGRAPEYKLQLSEIKTRVKKLGGKVLSKEYINSNHKLEFMCGKGHKWEAMPLGVLKGKAWCPTCSRNKKLDIDVMRKMARERGGEFLSKEYVNARTKYRWRCQYGHEWDATAGSIRNNGIWCYWCGRETTARKLRSKT